MTSRGRGRSPGSRKLTLRKSTISGPDINNSFYGSSSSNSVPLYFPTPSDTASYFRDEKQTPFSKRKRSYFPNRARNVNEDSGVGKEEKSKSKNARGTSNPNFSRTNKQLIRCNGIVSSNEVPEKITDVGVRVTTFNSIMTLNERTGIWEPTLMRNLLKIIETHGRGGVVVACVAWFSNPDIAEALSKCEQVLLVVNKQDFKTFANGICPSLYARLPNCKPICQVYGHLDTHLQSVEITKSVGKKSDYGPVRTWGKGNSLEHNKYMVFMKKRWVSVKDLISCDTQILNVRPYLQFLSLNGTINQLCKRLNKLPEELVPEDGDYFDFPFSYWTGSMNFTVLAESHHEGSEFIESELLAWSKFRDFVATWMESKPINGGNRSLAPRDRVNKINEKLKG